jgi:hypothetical protein
LREIWSTMDWIPIFDRNLQGKWSKSIDRARLWKDPQSSQSIYRRTQHNSFQLLNHMRFYQKVNLFQYGGFVSKIRARRIPILLWPSRTKVVCKRHFSLWESQCVYPTKLGSRTPTHDLRSRRVSFHISAAHLLFNHCLDLRPKSQSHTKREYPSLNLTDRLAQNLSRSASTALALVVSPELWRWIDRNSYCRSLWSSNGRHRNLRSIKEWFAHQMATDRGSVKMWLLSRKISSSRCVRVRGSNSGPRNGYRWTEFRTVNLRLQ